MSDKAIDLVSDSLTEKCPECGWSWFLGHNIACKRELRQEIKRLRADHHRIGEILNSRDNSDHRDAYRCLQAIREVIGECEGDKP